MPTQCIQKSFSFHSLGKRDVVARFDGGRITSDAGGLLLRQVEQKTGILRRFAACFEDYRDCDLIEHSVLELVSQRVYALALGYEDLIDHDELRHDPLLAVLVGKDDPTGMDRPLERDRGKACAGKSTLNRLELTPVGATAASRYKKIVAHQEAIEQLFLEVFVQSQHKPPRQIMLDLDTTDDPLHGHQLGRFFHGYYGHYCYLPLYIFAGQHLLCAKLRPSDLDAASGSVQELTRIVGHLRRRWPRVRIVVRADIKEQQLALFADRTSAETMRANHLRLWLSSVAYVLMSALRRLGLASTPWAGAQCDTIRLKLLKIGAQVQVTVRKVWLSLSEAYPYQATFTAVYNNLRRVRAGPAS
jgi:Transposase DDE domain group 1